MKNWFSILVLALLTATGCSKDLQKGLEKAIQQGDVGKVEVLLEEGAAANELLEEHQQFPLEMAADLGYPEIIRLLLKKGANPNTSFGALSPLWRAIESVNPESACYLVDAGADIQLPGPEGDLPMFYAVLDQDTALVKTLLKAGADPNDAGRNNRPLHMAAERGDLVIVQELIDAGAYVNAPDEFGEPPLFAAVQGQQSEVIDLLLQNNAEINSSNEIGESVVHEIIYSPNPLLLQHLINQGADPNHQDQAGETPLHRAAEANDLEMARVLLSNGAIPNPRNEKGETPEQVARSNQYLKLADFLRRKGL